MVSLLMYTISINGIGDRGLPKSERNRTGQTGGQQRGAFCHRITHSRLIFPTRSEVKHSASTSRSCGVCALGYSTPDSMLTPVLACTWTRKTVRPDDQRTQGRRQDRIMYATKRFSWKQNMVGTPLSDNRLQLGHWLVSRLFSLGRNGFSRESSCENRTPETRPKPRRKR